MDAIIGISRVWLRLKHHGVDTQVIHIRLTDINKRYEYIRWYFPALKYTKAGQAALCSLACKSVQVIPSAHFGG